MEHFRAEIALTAEYAKAHGLPEKIEVVPASLLEEAVKELRKRGSELEAEYKHNHHLNAALASLRSQTVRVDVLLRYNSAARLWHGQGYPIAARLRSLLASRSSRHSHKEKEG